VEYDFTASLEEQLDVISDGKLDWKTFLRQFWTQFSADIGETKDLRVTHVLDALNEALGPYVFPATDADGNPKENPRLCPLCNEGELSLKLGRGGAFVGCGRYPDCKYTRSFSVTGEDTGVINPDGEELGLHPDAGVMMFLKAGRFGPYVEMTEPGEEKPKRSSIPKGVDAKSVGAELAAKLLSLPREVGKHPEDGEPIVANLGRYGPYVQHVKTYANLGNFEELFEVGLNRAVTLIAEKKANPGRGRTAAKVLKDLGEHPSEGGPIQVLEGRYGPYVKHGKVNATLPKEWDPADVNVDQALELIAAKAAKGGKKKAAKKKTPAKKKAAAKK
ncbi:MAG: topoisomerase C-terminal repeat-containing protein, partial [Pseudomonadota bacterium]